MHLKIEPTWREALKSEFEKPYFGLLSSFVKQAYQSNPNEIFPEANYIFRAFDLCPFDQVKVVILGQDPYPNRGHAHGLCFSVEESVTPIPKSLQNIFKELRNDTGKSVFVNGSLLPWAKQGVLLLNAVLTVEEGKPDSHAGQGWEQFTDAVIRALSAEKRGIVYLLWGAKAQQKEIFVDTISNLVLKSVHPSPLSAFRGFFGSGHFSKTNAFLIRHGKAPINW
jgi:uracil-DNA glycosylase